MEKATSSATSSWARWSRSAASQEAEGRRPRRRAVPDRLRRLLELPNAACYARSARTPTRTPGWPRSCWATRSAGIFGYSHLMGGYAGGQAEYVRVPFADVGPIKVPDGLSDEQVLFLSDIFPTGYMGAEMCDIQPGDVVAVWGCGPGRAVRDAERVPAGRRARHRDRPLSTYRLRMAASSSASRRSTTTGGRPRGAAAR